MLEALTECDGELFVVNVDHISQLKACVNLKKTSVPNSPHSLKSVSYNIFLHYLYWSVIGRQGHLVIVGI